MYYVMCVCSDVANGLEIWYHPAVLSRNGDGRYAHVDRGY